jgi:diketogulonate reductase-like aldo/keto reductase
MRADFFLPVAQPRRPAPPIKGRRAGRDGAAFDLNATQARLHIATHLAELLANCARTGASVTFFEPPVRAGLNPQMLASVRLRVSTYRHVMATITPRGCHTRVLDFSQIASTSPLSPAGISINWLDRIHFTPVVGDALLPLLVPGDTG